MKLIITCVAIDADRRVKATYQEGAEIPDKVVKLHGMLAEGDGDEIMRSLSRSAMAAAVKAVTLTADSGARIAQEIQSGPSDSSAAKALGLDLIEHMEANESRRR